MRIGELCAGYGGLGMSVKAVLGGDIAWVSDICRTPTSDNPAAHYEPHRGPCKILAHRFPGVPNIGDMTTVDWTQVEPVDILTGGTPCQDLSHAGARKGMAEGTRSNLWVAMREAIAQLRPGLVVWENVRGAYSACADSEMGRCPRCVGDDPTGGHAPSLRALSRVLGDLSSLGYDARWHGLRAADVGAPHPRFRVFVVAYPHGEGRGGIGRQYGLARHVDGRGSADRLRPAGEPTTLLPTPAAYDGERGGPQHPDKRRDGGHSVTLQDAVHALLPTPTSSDYKGATTTRKQPGMDRGQLDAVVEGRAERLVPNAVMQASWGIYADAIARWEALTRPAPAPTQPSKKGTPQLSPRFSEWMMGLPEGWVTDVPGVTRNEALKAIGNGVCPQQCAAALRFLLGAEMPAVTSEVTLLGTPRVTTSGSAPSQKDVRSGNHKSRLETQIAILTEGGAA